MGTKIPTPPPARDGWTDETVRPTSPPPPKNKRPADLREAIIVIEWQRLAIAERDAEINRLRAQIAAMNASHRGE